MHFDLRNQMVHKSQLISNWEIFFELQKLFCHSFHRQKYLNERLCEFNPNIPLLSVFQLKSKQNKSEIVPGNSSKKSADEKDFIVSKDKGAEKSLEDN